MYIFKICNYHYNFNNFNISPVLEYVIVGIFAKLLAKIDENVWEIFLWNLQMLPFP